MTRNAKENTLSGSNGRSTGFGLLTMRRHYHMLPVETLILWLIVEITHLLLRLTPRHQILSLGMMLQNCNGLMLQIIRITWRTSPNHSDRSPLTLACRRDSTCLGRGRWHHLADGEEARAVFGDSTADVLMTHYSTAVRLWRSSCGAVSLLDHQSHG